MAWVKINPSEILKGFPNMQDYLPYLEELGKESPRGKVLISTGFMEQVLKEILCAFLIEGKVAEELLEGGSAPLGTFSARAKLAFTLGLISETEFQDLELIRKIRNEFAHNVKASFEDSEIRNRCKILEHRVRDHPDRPMRPEEQFTTAATGLLLDLVNRATYVSKKRRSYGKWKR
ncbi:MltR family transcriptional regulator [Bradyrhizobium sp. SHOUNA76]|uniref:MltR family transcriptional regulator n=1 Tax=Bradyrhizobium sp. SHOUNA76 TaxID=2908927 RepID=UPI001FF14D27|nr:MltR family transcriptional regulator [Bradyrhizobium sp. SHOUNA76]MCJ9700177.1 transcriptional regulator [Bradyrhizobium sp. SHOUNA76]